MGEPKATIADEPKVLLYNFPRGFCHRQADREVDFASNASIRFMKEHWKSPEYGPIIRDIIRQVRLHADAVLWDERAAGTVGEEDLAAFPWIDDELDPRGVVNSRGRVLSPDEALLQVVNQTLEALSWMRASGTLAELFPSDPLDRLRELILFDYAYPRGLIPTVMELDVAAHLNTMLTTAPSGRKPLLALYSSSHKRDDMREMLRRVHVHGLPAGQETRDYSAHFARLLDKPLVGSSRKVETYQAIAARCGGVPPGGVYYFTPSKDALAAARRAGMRAFLLDRHAPFQGAPGGGDILSFGSFSEIEFVTPSSEHPRGEIRIL